MDKHCRYIFKTWHYTPVEERHNGTTKQDVAVYSECNKCGVISELIDTLRQTVTWERWWL